MAESADRGGGVITHRIERRPGKLRVVLELESEPLCWDLTYQQAALSYLDQIRADLQDIAQTLKSEELGGRVVWFNEQKGYGFIRTYDAQDCFVHWTGIATDDGFKTLRPGQRVRFKRRQGRMTLEAIEVRPELQDES